MAELRPIPLPALVHRALHEPARSSSLFDLPLRKCWRPGPAARDLSVMLHGHRAQTPVGPAAGPHAQLAQNIALSWAAGARVIELKTVQILDQLAIPRPCIDAATVGFNVEWSQELPLALSLREYVAGAMLVRILRHTDSIGLGAAAAAAAPIFELSVGYSLEGLQTPAMREYLARVRDITPIVDELRAELAHEHPALAALDLPRELVSCVTLSTFHGCPPGEIEAIARYLLDEHGFDVIVKLNPTLLGWDEVSHVLGERLGYREVAPRRAAFDSDLGFDEAVAMARRLAAHAAARGRVFGVKMTNTLVVENHKAFFRPEEMYLSGPPLHVLAMRCADRFRRALGPEAHTIPVSFSGGIDAHNVADAIACDLLPVTTCTDLLKPGGYGRLPRYLDSLEEAMAACGAVDRDELVLRRFGHGAEAVREVLRDVAVEVGSARALEEELVRAFARRSRTLRAALADSRALIASACGLSPELLHARMVAAAGALNTRLVAERVLDDPRYAAARNAKPPRKVGSHLALFDCLSCDKCVAVCPNDANFSLATPPAAHDLFDVELDAQGRAHVRERPGAFAITRPSQWANFADACNDCGNCDVFCPEDGGPYVVKPRFFGSRASFADSALDGLFVERDGEGLAIDARVGGRPYHLALPSAASPRLDDGALTVTFDRSRGAPERIVVRDGARGPHRLPGEVYRTLVALADAVLDPARSNPVGSRLRR